MFCDLHCDTISKLLEEREKGNRISFYKNKLHIDLVRMKTQEMIVQNFALFVSMKETKKCFHRYTQLRQVFVEEMEHYSDDIVQVRSYREIKEARRGGKIAALMTVEEGEVCEGKIENVRQLFDHGVRMMTLTWNIPNSLGYPSSYPNQGLTKLGYDFVETMEELGMIVDVSHLSDKGIDDVFRVSKKPMVASHSNAREICSHLRNLKDSHIKEIARCGGIIGLNLYPPFLGKKGEKQEVIAHIKHLLNIGGENHIALGCDFDGMDGNVWIQGLEDLPCFIKVLEEADIATSIIDKICYKNVLNFYKEVL